MGKVSTAANLSRELRSALGDKTQAELAALLMVSRNYISQIEANLKTPSPRLEAQMQRMLTEANNAHRVSKSKEEAGEYLVPKKVNREIEEMMRQIEAAKLQEPVPYLEALPAAQMQMVIEVIMDRLIALAEGRRERLVWIMRRLMDDWPDWVTQQPQLMPTTNHLAALAALHQDPTRLAEILDRAAARDQSSQPKQHGGAGR